MSLVDLSRPVIPIKPEHRDGAVRNLQATMEGAHRCGSASRAQACGDNLKRGIASLEALSLKGAIRTQPIALRAWPELAPFRSVGLEPHATQSLTPLPHMRQHKLGAAEGVLTNRFPSCCRASVSCSGRLR